MSTESATRRSEEVEFEMLVNVLKAQTHIRNAEGWLTADPFRAGLLNDAKHALQRIVDDCSEANQRLADLQVNG